MGLNGLSDKSVRRIAQATGLTNIVRATVRSHGEHWLVMLTLDPHRHAEFNKQDGWCTLFPAGPMGLCTSLCRELFPDDFKAGG